MAEDPNAEGAQGAAAATPPSGGQQDVTTSAQGTPIQAAPPDDFDKERALATIRAQRESENKLKADLAALKADLDKARKAAMSEDERKAAEASATQERLTTLERETARLQRERQELLVRGAIERQARKMGVVDEEAAYRLLDLAALEYDETGAPKNADKALAELIKARPWLKGQQGAQPVAATSPANPGQQPDDPFAAVKADWDRRHKPQDAFDPQVALARGGGVLWTKTPEPK